MAKPVRNSLGPLLLHHGCDQSLADLVLEGRTSPIPSENKYNWLGPGITIWVDSPSRAMTWAREKQQKKPEEMTEPSVLGAFAYPGHCLNLTDYGALDELRVAHGKVKLVIESQGGKLPSNGAMEDGIYLYQPLDCLVIKMVHKLREESSLDAYDSVYGIFTASLQKAKTSFPDQASSQRVTLRLPFAILSALLATSESLVSPELSLWVQP
jgi:hypothetical protein